MVEQLSPFLDDPSISVSLAAGDYLVRAGKGALTLPAFERALASDILWARLRAGAYLAYRSREELQPMKSLIPALGQAINKQEMCGPEHNAQVERNNYTGRLGGQRDSIVRVWVLERVMKRIELAAEQQV